jgi:hypothetical protein
MWWFEVIRRVQAFGCSCGWALEQDKSDKDNSTAAKQEIRGSLLFQ